MSWVCPLTELWCLDVDQECDSWVWITGLAIFQWRAEKKPLCPLSCFDIVWRFIVPFLAFYASVVLNYLYTVIASKNHVWINFVLKEEPCVLLREPQKLAFKCLFVWMVLALRPSCLILNTGFLFFLLLTVMV